jgi:hypothetical protein
MNQLRVDCMYKRYMYYKHYEPVTSWLYVQIDINVHKIKSFMS